MNKKNILTVAVCGLMIASGAALAEDNSFDTNPTDAGTQGTGGVVHFTGKITDASCNVTTDSADKDVPLGDWAKSYFDSNDETTRTPFDISVEGCPSSVTKVAVLFDGNKDAADNTLLALNTSGLAGGDATGVAVKLYENDRTTQIDVGSVSQQVDITAGENGENGTATLNFYANYAKTGGDVTSGTANADSNFMMIYN